jgi:CRP-like cAMP-binding protein
MDRLHLYPSPESSRVCPSWHSAEGKRFFLALHLLNVGYRTGQVILREGRVGAAFFVLVSGSVEVVKESSGSEPVVLATLGAGEFFGEIATMQHMPRSASVRALQDTKCLVIWRLDFDSYIRRFPDVAAKVESALSARFNDRQDPED